ncbi:hypothetical protein ACFU6R_25225 [Streptomyces sp. NPDC057499]|uniref:hypothetical protein n=1 Tax=Streptomyces sp. NPDC057499 TaxID=3346150 RepID=UPI0036CFF437
MRRTGTTRRGALTATGAAALAAVLAGCGDGAGGEAGSGRSGAAATAARAAAVRAEKRIRTAAARTSLELLGRYERVAAAHPSAAAALAPLREAVRAHTEALAPSGGRAAGAAPSPAPPDDARAAVKELAAAERRASDTHLAALVDAPPELARLLASVAAADAAHAFLLTGIAKEVSS